MLSACGDDAQASKKAPMDKNAQATALASDTGQNGALTPTPTLGSNPVPTATPNGTPTVTAMIAPTPTAQGTVTPQPSIQPTFVPSPTPESNLPKKFTPIKLRIPSLQIDYPIVKTGLIKATDQYGRQVEEQEAPHNPFDIGWYQPDDVDKPWIPFGAPGASVLAGHKDYVGEPHAAFWRLQEIQPDAEIFVDTQEGYTFLFAPKSTEKLDVANYENWMYRVYDKDGPVVKLNLITCAGTFNYATRHYESRFVVFSEFVSISKTK